MNDISFMVNKEMEAINGKEEVDQKIEKIKQVKQEVEQNEPKISISKQEAEVRALLQCHVHRVISKGDDGFDDLKQILLKQPQWVPKIDSVLKFKITRSRAAKALKLMVKVDYCNPWLTVSWRKGVDKPHKDADPLQSAFRNAIRRQIGIWRKAHMAGRKCQQCESVKLLQVDHVTPLFIDMTRTFLQTHEAPKEFDYNGCRGRKFRTCDKNFAQAWRNYHAKHATYQWLCRTCNTRKNGLKEKEKN